MFLRPSSFAKMASLSVVLITAILVTWACKPRNSASKVKEGDAYAYDDSYVGPNMSSPECAADASKCKCFLGNEYDKYASEPEGSPKKKEWYRQCIGQELWAFATGTSSRYHTYTVAQRQNVPGDTALVFHTDDREHRFKNWGLVNDPNCCRPRSKAGANDGTCPDSVKFTQEDTYGMDFCPGDEELLKYVGNPDMDYTKADKGCHLSKLEDRIKAGIRTTVGGDDTAAKRSDSCYVELGTSLGAVGFRKFPNPRFDREKWKKLNNGDVASWENYSWRESGKKGAPNYGKAKAGTNRIDDGSVEPPFHSSQSCGSCHVGFAPTSPPKDVANPKWENIQYAIGNTFIHDTEIHASGAPQGGFEHEYIMYSRRGVVDTSAATNDYVYNPGTFNAIINLDRRPGFIDPKLKDQFPNTIDRFKEVVSTYRRDVSGKFVYGTKTEQIAHILKGGEDSVDASGGIMRVYANIFSCTETCLANHLDDPKSFSGRGSRQTPFEIEQCRRDCPGYAALEDRVYDILDFLLHVRPNDLKDAKDPEGVEGGGVDGAKIVEEIMQKKVDESSEPGSWYAAGKQVFGEKCAKCHSNMAGQEARAGLVENGNVRDIDVNKFVANADKRDEAGVRQEWFGSDVNVPQKVVDTFRCRSLHTNHMEGHLWEGYGSDTYRGRARYDVAGDDVFNYPEERLNKDNLGGRGFYRNISLINAWAHAPFMHNNGLGPDWDSPFLAPDRGSPTKWKKLEPIPSVKQRLAMYQQSMEQLFMPEDKREKTGNIPFKVMTTANPITFISIPMIPELPDSVWKLGEFAKSLLVEDWGAIKVGIPAGMPTAVFSSIRIKQVMHDLMQAIKDEPTPKTKAIAAQKFIDGVFGNLANPDPRKIASQLAQKGYSNCADIRDNGGHEFSDMNDTQKAQIIDFVKTL